MDTTGQLITGVGDGLVILAGGVLLLILAVLWFCLPFAIFGIKPLLKHILEQQRQMNEQLQKLTTLQEDKRQYGSRGTFLRRRPVVTLVEPDE